MLEQEIEGNQELLNKENSSNFFYRTFSDYSKKPGVDLYPWIALV